MRRNVGLIMFWMAIGMLIMLLISSKLIGIIIIFLLLIIGYNLFWGYYGARQQANRRDVGRRIK